MKGPHGIQFDRREWDVVVVSGVGGLGRLEWETAGKSLQAK